MKQFILIAAVICTAFAAKAQKGSILYFGDFGGSRISYDENIYGTGTIKDNRFLLNSGVGYQFSKHITLGVQGSFLATNATYRDYVSGSYVTTSRSATQYGVGLFGRYTQYLGDRFFVFLQADAGYYRWMQKEPYDSKYHDLATNLFPAVGVFIYKDWALNLNVGGVSYRRGGIGPKSMLTYSFGQQLRIGVSKNFTKKKSK